MATEIEGTLINDQLRETRDRINAADTEKNKVIGTMNEYGATGIAAGAPMSDINPALVELLDGLQKGENTTVVTFVLNPSGSDGYLPEDPSVLAAASTGAYIEIEEVDTTNVWRVPVKSIGPNVAVNFDNTFTKSATRIRARIVPGACGEAIRGRWQVAVIVNRAAVTLTLTTYLSDEQTMEIGRVFPIDSGNRDTFPIVATTANGRRTELFGRYAANGEWISETDVYAAIPEFDPNTGVIASWANGPAGRNDFEHIWPWSAARRVKFPVKDAAGVVTEMDMAGFDAADFYGIRVETRDITFATVQTDGTTVSAVRPCRIIWIARPSMPGYHVPSCAYLKEWQKNEAGQRSLKMSLLSGIYMSCHKSNTYTASVTDSETGERISRTAINSGTIGRTCTGLSCEDFANAAQTLNRCTMTDTRDTVSPVELPEDPTGRRWAASNIDTYSYFLPLFLVQFGIDSQNAMLGVSSSSVPQTKAGTTDPISDAGVATGVWGTAAAYCPHRFLHIENFGYGSEGTALCDLSWFSGRDTDEESYRTEAYVQPDRSAYVPNASDRAQITEKLGYLHVCNRDSGNSIAHLSGFASSEGVRDIHLPCAADDGFVSAKGCDSTDIYRSGQGTGKFALSNATCSRYRYGGRSLGVVAVGWCVGADGPGNAHGDYFGARVTLALKAQAR